MDLHNIVLVVCQYTSHDPKELTSQSCSVLRGVYGLINYIGRPAGLVQISSVVAGTQE